MDMMRSSRPVGTWKHARCTQPTRVLALAPALALACALVPVTGAAQMARDRAGLTPDSARRIGQLAGRPAFSYQQLTHRRVLEARLEKRFELKKLFRERGLTYPAAELFVRIFKRERVLEVWARPNNRETFTLLKSYTICALSGALGPKRAQGDGQTPEGIYAINGFNPMSDYFLSLRLDYPNTSDQILGRDARLGGDIFIHGGCRTIGCLAVTDDAIKELYWLAVEARNVGQMRIPVHIFPTHLTDFELNRIGRVFDMSGELKSFWANLRPVYDYFELHRKLPLVRIDEHGRYRVQAQIGKPAR
jgi:murein L,D-transpeptidase YafK